MKTLLIINPTSGRNKATRLRRHLIDLAAENPDIHIKVLTGPDDARIISGQASDQGFDRIVVAGGDGTFNQVINGIGDSSIPVGLIPLGTGNVLAYDLGLMPYDLDQALSVLNSGKIREIDLGKAGDRRFILMAGFGFDAEVVCCVATRHKSYFGRLAYAPVILKHSIKARSSKFKLTFDNGTVYEADVYAVIVSNCASYVYNFKIAPDAAPDDGILNLRIFERRPGIKMRFLSWLFRSLLGNTAQDFNITTIKTSRFHIDSKPIVKMQLDGDVYGTSGVDVEVLPKALKLIVP